MKKIYIQNHSMTITDESYKSLLAFCKNDDTVERNLVGAIGVKNHWIIEAMKNTKKSFIFNDEYTFSHENGLLNVEICAMKKSGYMYHVVVVTIEGFDID